MCAAVDTGDAEGFGSWFAEDASYRFGSSPAIRGRSRVVEATRGASAALPWVRHTVDQIAHVGDQLFCRFSIATANRSGAQQVLPCVTVIWLAGGKIVDYRVHMDLAPILA
jgi:ketosteroid isomerase-like protein